MNQAGLFEPLEIRVERQDKQLSFRFEFCTRIEPRRASVPNARIKVSVETTETSEVFLAANKVVNQ